MADTGYGFGKLIEGAPFDEVAERVRGALAEVGFGVLFEIPVHEKFKGALDVDFRRYLIMGACKPQLAHQAVQHEPEIGLLLPCNVLVQEAVGGGVRVSMIDPTRMLEVAGNAALQPIGAEANELLRRALDSL